MTGSSVTSGGAGSAGGDAATTASVAAEVAVVAPAELVAVTATRRVCPTSASVRVYAAVVACGMSPHPAPAASQRCQAYAKLVGSALTQLPLSAVSTLPARATPAMVGAAVLAGSATCEASSTTSVRSEFRDRATAPQTTVRRT